jgi:hypothetical protein
MPPWGLSAKTDSEIAIVAIFDRDINVIAAQKAELAEKPQDRPHGLVAVEIDLCGVKHDPHVVVRQLGPKTAHGVVAVRRLGGGIVGMLEGPLHALLRPCGGTINPKAGTSRRSGARRRVNRRALRG